MTVIRVKKSGPLVVEGDVTLIGPDGAELPKGGGRVLLCRCGATRSPPWCDASHHRVAPPCAPTTGDEP